MADIEKVKQGLKCWGNDEKCKAFNCPMFGYIESIPQCRKKVLQDALSVIEQMEQEIERLKARKPDCDHAEHDSDGCLGYGRSEQDDEPIDACKKCEKYTGKDCENDG